MVYQGHPAAEIGQIRDEIMGFRDPVAVRDALAGVTGRVEAVRDMLIQDGRKAEAGVYDHLRGTLLSLDAALGDTRREMIHNVDQLMQIGGRLLRNPLQP